MPAWLVKEEVRDLFPDHAAAIGAPGEEINGNWMSRLVRYRDGDDYYLVTPVEKCRITVEDGPFQVVLMNVTGEGISTCLQVTTDMGEVIPVDDEHPLRIIQDGAEWIPYVVIRDGMEGRLNRNVYYQLADLMISGKHLTLDGEWLGVWSHDNFFPMLQV